MAQSSGSEHNLQTLTFHGFKQLCSAIWEATWDDSRATKGRHKGLAIETSQCTLYLLRDSRCQSYLHPANARRTTLPLQHKSVQPQEVGMLIKSIPGHESLINVRDLDKHQAWYLLLGCKREDLSNFQLASHPCFHCLTILHAQFVACRWPPVGWQ